MNICLVNNLYPPVNTGSSFITESYAKYLTQRGHKVVVITNQVEGTEFYSIKDKVIIYRLPKIHLPKLDLWMKFSEFNLSIFPSNLKKIKKILIKEKIELIHQCNNIFDLVFASAYFSRKLNIPLICSLTTQMQHTNTIYLKLLELFDKTVIKKMFSKYVTKYIALDKETKLYIKKRYNLSKNVELIPFTISHNFNKKYVKKDYNKTNFIMISLGHVSNLKNRFDIIEAWSYVVKKYKDAKILIVGDIFNRDTKKMIEHLNLQNNIIFTGKVPHNEIYKYIEQADFSCMFLSRNLPFHRGVGVANLETMSFGIPTVIDADDNFFGNKFPFKSGLHFIKAEREKPKLLADIFINLFENPELREKIGKNGQDFVKNVLVWDRIIEEIETIYMNVLSAKKAME